MKGRKLKGFVVNLVSGRQNPDTPSAGQPATASEPVPEIGNSGTSPAPDVADMLERSRRAALGPEDARALLIAAQQILSGPESDLQYRTRVRKVIDNLVGNPSVPTDVLHSAVVFHDGTRERERDWRHGNGSENTTRLVVHNPSTAARTLELISLTPQGKVSYEAWKQLKLKGRPPSN